MTRFILSIFDPLWRYAARLRAARNQILTERLLDSLPLDLRKDIGWPDSYFDSTGRVEWDAQSMPGERWDRGKQARAADHKVVTLQAPARRRSVPVLRVRKSPVSS